MHFQIGDIVVRTDVWSPTRGKVASRKRYVIVRIADDGSGWIYTRPINGTGTVTFPSQFMLKKVG